MRAAFLFGLLLASSAAVAQPITVTGKARYEPSSLEGEQVCLFPTERSQRAILEHLTLTQERYEHDVWFCFIGPASPVAKALGASTKLPGTSCGFEVLATVQVTGYRWYSGEGDSTDQAKLVKVQKRGSVIPLHDCEDLY